MAKKRQRLPCVVRVCPAWQRPCGCGYLTCGTPCRHPKWRTAWQALQPSRCDQSTIDTPAEIEYHGTVQLTLSLEE